MKVVFSDLDGTLLDHDTYSWEAARPALILLARRRVPLVLCTSKTRAEVETLRSVLGNDHPFITENGGAAFVPRDYFPFPVPGARARDNYEVVEFGTGYQELVHVLKAASEATGVEVSAFHQMTVEEVARRCGLPVEQGRLAKQREYDEPFEIPDSERAGVLLQEIEAAGMRWTRGGRFHHVTGGNDKAAAVAAVTGLYRKAYSPVQTVGLGDGLNDAEFLNQVDIAILISSPGVEELQRRVPRGKVTSLRGPAGWNQAILEMSPE